MHVFLYYESKVIFKWLKVLACNNYQNLQTHMHSLKKEAYDINTLKERENENLCACGYEERELEITNNHFYCLSIDKSANCANAKCIYCRKQNNKNKKAKHEDNKNNKADFMALDIAYV